MKRLLVMLFGFTIAVGGLWGSTWLYVQLGEQYAPTSFFSATLFIAGGIALVGYAVEVMKEKKP